MSTILIGSSHNTGAQAPETLVTSKNFRANRLATRSQVMKNLLSALLRPMIDICSKGYKKSDICGVFLIQPLYSTTSVYLETD